MKKRKAKKAKKNKKNKLKPIASSTNLIDAAHMQASCRGDSYVWPYDADELIKGQQ